MVSNQLSAWFGGWDAMGLYRYGLADMGIGGSFLKFQFVIAQKFSETIKPNRKWELSFSQTHC